MAEVDRIDELRRRLQKDPASIAFAQLAEEYRRASRFREAIETCRAGLSRHPGYLSARVTLGRALLETGELESAQHELADVLRVAPENLAAIRGLAEVHRRRGELPEALEQYRAAFELARNDPGIDQIVREIRKEIEPSGSGRPATGSVVEPRPAFPTGLVRAPDAGAVSAPSTGSLRAPAPGGVQPPSTGASRTPGTGPGQALSAGSLRAPADAPAPPAAPVESPSPADVRARRVVQHLERWLAAIIADRRVRLMGT